MRRTEVILCHQLCNLKLAKSNQTFDEELKTGGIVMTAPPEEQGDAGPLVPCKVALTQKCLLTKLDIS